MIISAADHPCTAHYTNYSLHSQVQHWSHNIPLAILSTATIVLTIHCIIFSKNTTLYSISNTLYYLLQQYYTQYNTSEKIQCIVQWINTTILAKHCITLCNNLSIHWNTTIMLAMHWSIFSNNTSHIFIHHLWYSTYLFSLLMFILWLISLNWSVYL